MEVTGATPGGLGLRLGVVYRVQILMSAVEPWDEKRVAVVEGNFHRDYPLQPAWSGGLAPFRRPAGSAGGGRPYRYHPACQGVVQVVDVNFNVLARPYPADLSFFHVGFHPYVPHVYQGYNRLTRRYGIAYVGPTGRDHPGPGRDHFSQLVLHIAKARLGGGGGCRAGDAGGNVDGCDNLAFQHRSSNVHVHRDDTAGVGGTHLNQAGRDLSVVGGHETAGQVGLGPKPVPSEAAADDYQNQARHQQYLIATLHDRLEPPVAAYDVRLNGCLLKVRVWT